MSRLLQRAVDSSIWATWGSFCSGVLGLAISAATIRMLGIAMSGFASAIITLTGLVATIGSFGLGTAAIREVSMAWAAGDRTAIKRSGGLVLGVWVLVGLVGAIAMLATPLSAIQWAGGAIAERDARWFCALAGVSFFASQWGAAQLLVLDGLLRFDLRAYIQISTLGGQMLATVVVLMWSPSLISLGCVNASVATARSIALSFAVRHAIGVAVLPCWSFTGLLRFWHFARWGYLSSLTGLGLSGLDRVLLVSLFGSGCLPFYNMSRRFYELVHEALCGQTAYLLPLLGSEPRDPREIVANLDDRLRWYVAALAGWLYTGVLLIGPYLLSVMVSPSFAYEVRYLLLVMVFTGLLHAQAIVTNHAVQAEGHPAWSFALFACCGLGVLPVMYVLGCSFGFEAAVGGQLSIGVFAMLFLWLCAPRGKVNRIYSIFSPIFRSSILFIYTVPIYLSWCIGWLGAIGLVVLGMITLILYFPVLCRWEPTANLRTATLLRALRMVIVRFGVASPRIERLMCRVLGLKEISYGS